MRELPGDAQTVRLVARHALAVNTLAHFRERLRGLGCATFRAGFRSLREEERR